MWWKQNKWKVIAPVLAAALLAAAFWYGGSAPGMQGRPTTPDETASAASSPLAPEPSGTLPTAPEPTDSPEPSVPTSAPSADPSPTAPNAPEAPDAATEPTDSPAPGGAEGTDPDADRDPYLTDPVPEGKPLPVEPQDAAVSDTARICTISISCAAILDNMDWLDPEKAELVPEDGWLLSPTEVTFYEGESVFNVLQRTCKQQKLHMEFENTPMYNSAYIEGIGNLYEFDCGELSGWMYRVNDWFPNYGCSRYQLREGDVIEWIYTCDLGADAGSNFAARG